MTDPSYDRKTTEELEALIVDRGLIAPETGSGSDGRVVKADLVAVLESADAEVKPSTPEEVGRPPLSSVAVERAAEREKRVRHYGAGADTEEQD